MKFDLHFSKYHSVIWETVFKRWLLQNMSVPVTFRFTFLCSHILWYLCCDDCSQKDMSVSVDLLRWRFSFLPYVFGIELWLTICSLKWSTHSECTVSCPFKSHTKFFLPSLLSISMKSYQFSPMKSPSLDFGLRSSACTLFIKSSHFVNSGLFMY